MKLLTAEEVKTEKRRVKDLQEERIRKLNEEAALSAKKINEAREFEKSELARIDANVVNAQKVHDESIEGLRQEVAALEARKKEALRPLRDREVAIEKAELEIISKNQALNDATIEIEDAKVQVRLEKEKYIAMQKEFEIRDLDLKQREEDLKKERAELDTYFQNSTELLKREQARLREYFEAEDNLKKHG